jgi:hypothetical protein
MQNEMKTYREQHVGLVLLYGFGILDDAHRLVHTDTLSSQDRLVDPEACRGHGEQDTVGRDLVAYADLNNVTGYKFRCMEFVHLSRTNDLGLIRGVFLESL